MADLHWLSMGLGSVPAGDDWLTPREAAWAQRMRFPKRRSEYRMARWCAKNAVAALSTPPPPWHDIEIGHLPEGAPAAYIGGAPYPRRISMTDRADWAVCAVGPDGVEVGCDLELVEPRSTAFVRDYLVPVEQELALRDGTVDPVMANLIWSAKESALKVLRTGLRRDTRSVTVSVETGDDGSWLPLEVMTVEGERFAGWWRRFGDFLLTICGDGATAPPQTIIEPAPLATAEPGHAWLLPSN